MLQNSPTSIFNSNIFSGVIPWIPVKQEEGPKKKGEGKGKAVAYRRIESTQSVSCLFH